jgi:hypothetical protein
MKKPNLEKYVQEINEMQMLQAASVEIPPLAAVAIISHIQLAIRHPAIVNTEFAKIAIDVATQLQKLFNKDSETYKVLELGWNPEADILTPSGELHEAFCDEPIPPKTLATGAAPSSQRLWNFTEDFLQGLIDM